MRGLRVVVIVGKWKHIVRVGHKTEIELKQGVEIGRIKSDTYVPCWCPCPVESHGRVNGLYTLQSSHEEALLPTNHFYTHLTKRKLNSAEHTLLFITTKG